MHALVVPYLTCHLPCESGSIDGAFGVCMEEQRQPIKVAGPARTALAQVNRHYTFSASLCVGLRESRSDSISASKSVSGERYCSCGAEALPHRGPFFHVKTDTPFWFWQKSKLRVSGSLSVKYLEWRYHQKIALSNSKITGPLNGVIFSQSIHKIDQKWF